MKKTLFFSPNSAVWQFAFPEALIAEELAREGNEIIYVTCDGAFEDFCIAMSAHGLAFISSTEEKRKVCAICHERRAVLRHRFALTGPSLDSFLTEALRAKASHSATTLALPELFELVENGIPVGRLATYEFLINTKKIDLKFNAVEEAAYRSNIKNTLLSLYAAERALDTLKPDNVIIYNTLYSAHSVWWKAAAARNIKTYFLHAGLSLTNRQQSLILGKDSTFNFLQALRSSWEKRKDVPLDKASIDAVTAHFLELFKGRDVFAYSSPSTDAAFSARKRFKVPEEATVFVAAMSSYDERYAAQTSGHIPTPDDLLFPTQLDWIQYLIGIFKERPDWFLVIRVHPREFPNKREQVKSQHAAVLEESLRALPPNVVVNWPADQISLYQLANETQVFLTAWSSVGKEASLLGLPVVIYAPSMIWYPPELNLVATTRQRYLSTLESAAKQGWSFERVRTAFRWYALELHQTALDLSGSPSLLNQGNPSLVRKVFRRALRAIHPRFLEGLDCARRSRKPAAAQGLSQWMESDSAFWLAPAPPPLSAEEEAHEIREAIHRFGKVLYGKSGPSEHSSLREHLLNAETPS